jgi:quercetin dioxygenase-like cupin family protein
MTSQRQSTVASAAFLRGPGDGDQFDNPTGGAVTYRARGEETDGALTVIETVVAPGEGPPLHVHVSEDEFIYVLEGRLRFRLAGALRDAPAGSFVFIPKGSRTRGNTLTTARHGFCSASCRPRRAWSASSSKPPSFRPSAGLSRGSEDSPATRGWRSSVRHWRDHTRSTQPTVPRAKRPCERRLPAAAGQRDPRVCAAFVESVALSRGLRVGASGPMKRTVSQS